MQIRQGDVFLERIKKLPDGEQKRVASEGSRLILVRGEATGHHHSVSARSAILMLIGTEMFLRCLKKNNRIFCVFRMTGKASGTNIQ